MTTTIEKIEIDSPLLASFSSVAMESFRRQSAIERYKASIAILTNSEDAADTLVDLALAFAQTTAEQNTTIFASVIDAALSRLARGDSVADVAAWISSLKPTEIDKIDWIAKRSETIVNLTIDDHVIPCRVTEKPDFDTDGDEPIELKWRLSCEVDDAGYSVFDQAYYRGTFCSLGVATSRGVLEDLHFFKTDKDTVTRVDFTFRRLAMMRSPRSEWYRQKGQSRLR